MGTRRTPRAPSGAGISEPEAQPPSEYGGFDAAQVFSPSGVGGDALGRRGQDCPSLELRGGFIDSSRRRWWLFYIQMGIWWDGQEGGVEIVGRERLEKFARRHAAARKPVRQWLDVAEAATWQRPADIRQHFNSVDFLDGNRVIFNLGGNHYRLLVVAIYAVGKLNVRWIGTHAEYSKLKL